MSYLREELKPFKFRILRVGGEEMLRRLRERGGPVDEGAAKRAMVIWNAATIAREAKGPSATAQARVASAVPILPALESPVMSSRQASPTPVITRGDPPVYQSGGKGYGTCVGCSDPDSGAQHYCCYCKVPVHSKCAKPVEDREGEYVCARCQLPPSLTSVDPTDADGLPSASAAEFSFEGGQTSSLPDGAKQKYTLDEQARPCHVYAAPENMFTLSRWKRGMDRTELDLCKEEQKELDPWNDRIGVCVNGDCGFNCESFMPQNINADHEVLKNIDPSHPIYYRSGGSLYSKWSTMQSDFSKAYDRWSASGQNDPLKTFEDFARSAIELYMFFVFKDSPALSLVVRCIPKENQEETPLGSKRSAPNPAVKKKQKKTTLVTVQSEVDHEEAEFFKHKQLKMKLQIIAGLEQRVKTLREQIDEESDGEEKHDLQKRLQDYRLRLAKAESSLDELL